MRSILRTVIPRLGSMGEADRSRNVDDECSLRATKSGFINIVILKTRQLIHVTKVKR